MPKKFTTENTKAVAAKARKEGKKEEDQARKQKEVEDAQWKDGDKKVAKKQQKKGEEEQKRLQQQQKKAEAKELLEKEMSSIASTSKKAPEAPTKRTRAQIEKANEKAEFKAAAELAASAASSSSKIVVIPDNVPLEENINRMTIDEEVAHTVDEAIVMLRGKDSSDANADGDAHPERRMRAAYATYAERRLPELKRENPSLRLSQLKQMMFKDWSRAPENPMRTKE